MARKADPIVQSVTVPVGMQSADAFKDWLDEQLKGLTRPRFHFAPDNHGKVFIYISSHTHKWGPWEFTHQSIEVRKCNLCGELQYD